MKAVANQKLFGKQAERSAARHLIPLIAVLFLCSCVHPVQRTQGQRDAAWAEPCPIEGVGNCFRLEEGLYRSEQPTRQGLANLEKEGINNLLSLRPSPDNLLACATMLRCHSVPMNAFCVDEEALVEALSVMVAARNRPLVVHCYHGADRTGLVCAAYRIVVQGWPKEKAIDEMLHGGYGFHGFFTNIVRYIRKMKVEEIRCRLVVCNI